ncbi:hypothetical protein BGZ72_010153 [Mortierella alpina]|nr:hypothetical protein BGZ72_010153 [Mortierella alpina]
MSSAPSPSSRASSASLHVAEEDPTTSQTSSASASAATSAGDTAHPAGTADAGAGAGAAAKTAAADAPQEPAAFINIKLHPRKGLPLTHCRAPKSFPGPFDITLSMEHDSYKDFCSRIRTHITTSLPEFSWPETAHPYIRPTHSATQTHYLELTEANFQARINKAWRTESRRLDGTEEVYIHVFAYLIKAEKEKDGRGVKGVSPAINSTGFSTDAVDAPSQRNGVPGSGSGSGSSLSSSGSGTGAGSRSGAKSTAVVVNGSSSSSATNNSALTPPSRYPRSAIAGTSINPAIQIKMDEAERRILIATQQHIIPPLGPVSTEMFARHLAMLPTMPSAQSLELPTTLTFRQAMQLDEQARGLKRRMEAEESAGSDEYRTVRVKIQGVVMPIQIELRSLREALGLQPGVDTDGDM